MDADYTMGHLDYLLGLNPKNTIQHIVEGKADFEKTVLNGPWGLKLIPGMSGLDGNPNIPRDFSRDIIRDLAMYSDWSDIMMCDTTSGASSPTMDVILNCDDLIMITTPETASVMDLYSMIKVVHQKMGDEIPRLRLIVNRTNSRDEGRRIASSLRGVIGRFLGKGIHFMGAIPSDPEVDHASRKHIPFIRHAPTSVASRTIEEIAFSLLNEWENVIGE